MTKSSRCPLIMLAIIVALYLVLAILYATFTPIWQVPDEPAHYNYARFLAENRRFPVLQAGDYPHQYLEEIKARRFPPDMSIDPIRYEYHQPPLYYVLAAGVYALFAGATLSVRVIAMRLISVVLGAALLVVVYQIVKMIFSRRPALALGTAAFIAFIPMHLTFNAAISNDTLTELMVALVLYALMRYLAWRTGSAGLTPLPRLIGLGVLVGLAMVTKSSTYAALPAVVCGLAWGEGRYGRGGRRLADIVRALVLVGMPALLIAAPWFIRNILTYGDMDIWGLMRHDAVVVGQPRTAEWVAEMGWLGLLTRFLRTTFQSFWAQFGWMGILIDSRLYGVLALFSVLIALGVLLAGWRLGRGEVRLTTQQKASLGVLGLSGLTTVAGYLWYNLQFVQHQGRYLFPALIPIGLLAAIGMRELCSRRGSLIAACVLAAGFLALLVFGFVRGDWPALWLAVAGALAVAFGLRVVMLPPSWSGALTGFFYAGMLALDVVCLFGFIVPYFQ